MCLFWLRHTADGTGGHAFPGRQGGTTDHMIMPAAPPHTMDDAASLSTASAPRRSQLLAGRPGTAFRRPS